MRKDLKDTPERIWNFEREMVDWRLRDRPDVSPDNGDDEMYNEMGLVDHRDLGGFLCLVMPFVFKLKNESVAFVIPIPFSATEVETTRCGRS